MKYATACLLEGPVADYQQRLIREIADRFDLRFTLDQAPPPHFRLNYPFDTDDIGSVERTVDRFCAAHTRTSVEIGGFGEFRPDIVFLKVQLSPAAQTTFEEFLSELHQVAGVPWNPYDGDGQRLPVTLAEECDPKLQEVRELLQGQEKWFSCWFDNITLFVQTGAGGDVRRWSIHRRFTMT